MKQVLAAIGLAVVAAALPACRDVHGEARPPARAVKVIEPQPAGRASGTRYAVTIQPAQQILL